MNQWTVQIWSDRDALSRLISHTVLKIKLSKFRIDILYSLETKCFSATYLFHKFSSVFFIITFNWKWNFKFWGFHRKDLVQIYQNKPYFNFKIYFCIHKNQFLGEKIKIFFYLHFFFINYRYRDIIGHSNKIPRGFSSKLYLLSYVSHSYISEWQNT